MPPHEPRKKRTTKPPHLTGPALRADWALRQRGLDPGDVFTASSNADDVRALAENIQPKAPPGGPGSVNWTPIGPRVVIRGQARPRPTVSGRILSIEVGPLGQRAYVAAADGGVWRYERLTSGLGRQFDTWTPSDDFVMSPGLVNLASGNALSTSALLVQFGANESADTIFVGTGEPGFGTVQQNRNYWGVGVRIAPGVVSPNPRVWHLEAPNLAGQAIYRLFQDPDNIAVIWAATTIGLFQRPAAAVLNTPWTQVGNVGAQQLPAGQAISDVVITGAGVTKAIFAAVDTQGVYRSVDNGATWQLLAITPNSNQNPGRIALAVSNTANQVVYRWDSLGRLWRFDGVRLRRVQTTPPAAASVGTQGWYDLTVAVVPGTDDTVIIGGSLVWNDDAGNPLNPGDWDAALYRSALVTAGVERRFGFVNAANPDRDATFIGAGVHPDCHAIAFARDAAGANLIPGEVWIGCDGGVFRSLTGNVNTFTAVNESLTITQPTYFDQHPAHDAIVFAGTQDNGTVRHDGSALWRVVSEGDGGGVAIDQLNPLRVMMQYTNASLNAATDGGLSGAAAPVNPPLSAGEPSDTYARLTSSPAVEPTSTVLYPTDRIWATYDWGARWRVLPRNVTPNAAAAATSRLDGNLINDVVWIAQNRFHAATTQQVFRFDRTARNAINQALDVWTNPATGLAVTGLPAGRTVTSLGVVNPATDDIYVGLGGASTGVDHVWWFDSAAATWRPTTLGPGLTIGGVATPFDAPVTALVVDPAATNNVYAGTDVGVFRGVRSAAAPFTWVWTLFSAGLPEANVQDLKVHAPTRLLRASLHGRGVWEIDLAAAVGRDPDVFVRMNDADGGRHLSIARGAAHPFLPGPRTVNWTMSPDVKIRRGIAAQAPPPFRANLRFVNPRQTGARVTCWQQHAIRRGFTIGADPVGRFDVGSRAAARAIQARFGLTTNVGGSETLDGIVGQRTWVTTTSWPALPVPMTAQAFNELIAEDTDSTNDEMIADATGVNQVYVQLHNRGNIPIAPGNLRAALLVAASDAIGTVPNLPAGYAARVRGADVTNWVGATGWRFVDAATVYRTNEVELNARQTTILEWDVDYAALGFAAGAHVLMVVLAHATSAAVGATDNTLTSAEVVVRTLIEGAGAAAGEVKAAARLVRLDAAAVIPPAP